MSIMVFAEIKPQMEQLPHEEMVKAMAFLKSRLRADDPANQAELSRRHAEMDAGKKVRWEDLKQQLGQ
jgi:hypothetical protein